MDSLSSGRMPECVKNYQVMMKPVQREVSIGFLKGTIDGYGNRTVKDQ